MADLQTQSPEATYASKGNIVVQKAHSAAKTVTDVADGPSLPNAEGTIEDHLPTGATLTAGSLRADSEGNPGGTQASTLGV